MPRTSLSRSFSGRGSPPSSNSRQSNGLLSVSKNFSAGDSSDDEVPEPKFSASVKALLEGDALSLDTSPRRETSVNRRSIVANDNPPVLPITKPERHVRVASPHRRSTGSPNPRVVRVGSVRAISRSDRVEPSAKDGEGNLITPASRPRSVRIIGSRSNTRSLSSISPTQMKSSESDSPEDRRSAGLDGPEEDYICRLGNASMIRPRAGEEVGMHSSLHVKRVGRLTGSFLNGPARRGVLRRQSGEINEISPEGKQTPSGHQSISDRKNNSDSYGMNYSRPTRSAKLLWLDSDPPAPAGASKPRATSCVDVPSPTPSSPKLYKLVSKSTPGIASYGPSKSSSRNQQPVFSVPPLPPMSAADGQENEPPPTFKRARPQGFSLLDNLEKISVIYDEDKRAPNAPPVSNSPRKPLLTRSNNTPHRAPPPPPKMSVLETATATGGAVTTSQSRKKRSQVTINHKVFTRMDCIGRGGSSRVYRVMAENYKIFALKRVNLEDVDRLTLAGYKGEIDLLKKLENVDRVVRLFDWELNSEKHFLCVLMEIGESDLEKILTYRLNAEDATFDMSFTRYYWKEMLECVQAVHKFNIVHSDLKPANFLLVQGRLKLIDFGIANAIQDNTVNVHREQQVGTPNYMSPEALVDSNAALGLPASVGKVMKLGKPSDVWSLGCILYKMVYGQPPFAKIVKYYERIMAIPNPKVPIEFPPFAVGGITVPPGLVQTMKRCLQRDQTLRPTVEELLGEREPFLYPEAHSEGTVPVTQEMLTRIITNVVNHCRVRGVPKDNELATWPAGFFARIKAALEDERIQ